MNIAKELIHEEYIDELKQAMYEIIGHFIYCEKYEEGEDDYLKLVKIPTSDGSLIEVCAAYGSIKCISADEYGDYCEDDDDEDEPMELISISVENNEKRIFQSIPVFDRVDKDVISGVLQAIHEMLED